MADSEATATEMANGWKHFSRTATVPVWRSGWLGLWDKITAWWTGEPRRTVSVTFTASVYAKGADKMHIDIWNEQLEQGNADDHR